MATILIIDDNDTMREGLAHACKKIGHDAVAAASGTDGLAAFKQKRADFVDHRSEDGRAATASRCCSAISASSIPTCRS